MVPTGFLRPVWSTQWGANCRGKGIMEQWPRSSLAHRVTAGMSDRYDCTRGPRCPICHTAGVHAERGGKEQIAPETKTEDVVVFCFLAYPAKILQKNHKGRPLCELSRDWCPLIQGVSVSERWPPDWPWAPVVAGHGSVVGSRCQSHLQRDLGRNNLLTGLDYSACWATQYFTRSLHNAGQLSWLANWLIILTPKSSSSSLQPPASEPPPGFTCH